MKKKVFGRKLSRSRPSREALFASLGRAMILNGKMVTTYAKAKAVQRDIEKFVTLSKKGDLSSRRKALANLDNSKEAADFLFQKIASAFSNRNSGFTRIIPLPARKGDNARMVRMEWTDQVDYTPAPVEKKAKKEKTVKVKEVKKAKETKVAAKKKEVKK